MSKCHFGFHEWGPEWHIFPLHKNALTFRSHRVWTMTSEVDLGMDQIMRFDHEKKGGDSTSNIPC